MRTRILLLGAALAALLVAGGLLAFDPFRAGGDGPRAEQRACAEDGGGEAERERERSEAGSGVPCEEFANTGKELQEPADALLARQLTGADPGIDVGRFFAAAVAQGDALGAKTATVAPTAATARWTLVGPTTIGGRILDVVVDPTRPDTVFAATASGGIWKSTDKGVTLLPAWPSDLTQATSALAVAPDGTLYAGTGEAGPGGGSITYGGTGVYRSTDGGATWQSLGLADTSRIGRIALDPRDPKRIFVAGTGPLYQRGGGRGLYLSEDGGQSFTRVLKGDTDIAGAVDVAIDPRDSQIVYAAMWDNFREADRRTYEGLGSGLYKSTDGGKAWERIGTPYFGPRRDLGRIGVAVAPDGTVYANASGASGTYSGFYSSADGGATWTLGRPSVDQVTASFVYGWWFGRIYVDPKDSAHVYWTGVSLEESKDGGRTFRDATRNAHVDQHGMAWDPRVPGRLYLGNDGGLYRSDDNGQGLWRKAQSMPFSQINGLDISQQDPSRMVVGLQDNGGNLNWKAPSGPGTDSWRDYTGGDGQRVSIAPDRQSVIYGCYQYGECVVSTDAGATTTSFNEGVVSSRKSWFAPIEFDPQDSRTVYTGGEILSRSDDDAQTWTPISPDLTNGPGRETNPLFRNYGTITTIAPAPKASGTIYAGTDDGNLWFTHDASNPLAWTKVADARLPKAWITRVEVDPADPNTAYVTYSGFRQADDAPYVFRTSDGGRTWTDLTADLPSAPVNDVNVIGDAVVVASDVGVFFRRPGAAGWLRLGDNLPLSPAYELRYHAATKTLYVGTFGRSAWKIDATLLTGTA